MDGVTDIDSRKVALFQAAEFGHINLIDYLLNKGMNIDEQDEEGDTLLHHAAKWGHSTLVCYLLRHQANAFIKNKKDRTALLEAYAGHHYVIAKKITLVIVAKNAVNSLHSRKSGQTQEKFDKFINECKEHISKNYLNRGIFSRFMARHTERAKVLRQALDRCTSAQEARGLIKNQRNLFEKGKTIVPISSELLDNRWATQLKNKPNNLSKSSFYKILNTMPGQKPLVVWNRRQAILPQHLSIKTLLTTRV
ncbi:MAG: ankyrin repeat domain-containing protein [Pseudomonadota bacterium]